MKAAIFHGPGAIEAEADVARPTIGPDEVLIRVHACGICGSDMHIYRVQSEASAAMHSGTLRVDADGRAIIGHEYSGVIAEVGEGVQGYRVGQRVVGVTAGGGMAEYVPVPVNPYQLVAMPEEVSFEAAATTEPLADALQMVRLARLQPGENVVVFGVGIIGLGVIQVLRALDVAVGQIIAIDVADARLAMAQELGATAVINPAREDVLARTAELCGTLPFRRGTVPNVSAVIDCAGYIKHMQGPAPLQYALDMLKPSGGRIVCFGAFEDEVRLNLMPVIQKQISIFGSLGYASEELDQALALMASGRIDRDRLISHRFPLDQVDAAFAAQGGRDAIKVMVLP